MPGCQTPRAPPTSSQACRAMRAHAPFCAVRSVVLTVDPAETCGAGAGVAVHAVGAVAPVAAGAAGTLVDVLLAEGALEARQAVAEGCVDAVRTRATVVAGVWEGTGAQA